MQLFIPANTCCMKLEVKVSSHNYNWYGQNNLLFSCCCCCCLLKTMAGMPSRLFWLKCSFICSSSLTTTSSPFGQLARQSNTSSSADRSAASSSSMEYYNRHVPRHVNEWLAGWTNEWMRINEYLKCLNCWYMPASCCHYRSGLKRGENNNNNNRKTRKISS